MPTQINDDRSALSHYLKPLAQFMDDDKVTEICVQHEGRVFVENHERWTEYRQEEITYSWCRHLAQLIATSTNQRVNAQSPLLSAGLPNGNRIQIVLPPATLANRVALTIRKPNRTLLSLNELDSRGFFSTIRVQEASTPLMELTNAYNSQQWLEFLKLAVLARLNIVVAGATGSGKTTLTKALIAEIPQAERIVSIEDTPELELANHPNSVQLLYSKDGQGTAKITPKQLLEASLRLRPDRIMLAELRGEEAYYYCRNISSGHAGSITSVHAGSPATAFIQLGFLIKESAPGRDMASRDIQRMLRAAIDLVVVCQRAHGRRSIRCLWWKGQAKSAR